MVSRLFFLRWLGRTVCLLSLSLLLCCGKESKEEGSTPFPAPPKTPGEEDLTELTLDPETHAWWVQRANNSLRLSQPLEELASHREFKDLKPRDVAAKMMDDESFYDMMTDFTMYWLGIKGPQIRIRDYDRTRGEWAVGVNQTVARQQQVINAVHAMAKGGNYFDRLFAERGPLVVYDLQAPFPFNDDGSPRPPRAEMRAQVLAAIQLKLLAMEPLATEATKTQFCAHVFGGGEAADASLFQLKYMFGSVNTLSDEQLDPAEFPLVAWCFLPNYEMPADIVQRLSSLKKVYTDLEVDLNQFDRFFAEHDPHIVPHVTSLKTADRVLNRPIEARQYTSGFFEALQNSSTNRNRKRASWVLKRFFCDDLTPINVEAPATHMGGQHGSDPSCYSCHYKLDPMAGYFRELGNSGTSYAADTHILFDDGVRVQRSEYEKDWRAPAGSGREWNIGYVRSTTDESLNTRGENFADLLKLLQTAPEVKECFVRRVFEYVVAENQTVDRGWIKAMANKMTETQKTSTTQAIKDVFSEVITSRAYVARERDNNECYDLPNGVQRKGRAPCRIATVIERNCASCHSTTNRQGGLDLTTWSAKGDGQFGFSHEINGQQIERTETFQRMAERLNEANPARRMPLLKNMPATEREELYLWLQEIIARKDQ